MTTKQEHDAITGETVVRDMTTDELELAKIDADEEAAYLKAEAAKAKAKADVIAKLGLTADEVASLLS
jgi:hypothetical protein